MDKPALNEHPIHEILRRRWSPRAFGPESIAPTTVHSLIEAARWSASCYNDQPWAFIVATKEQPELYTKVLSCLIPWNQEWAKSAPLLILTFAHKNFARNGKPNSHARYDLGQAVAQLTAQASAEGLYAHQMAGIEYDKIRTEFTVPDDWEPMTAIAIGHPGAPESLPESFREMETAARSRNPFSTFVFGEKWGEANPNVK